MSVLDWRLPAVALMLGLGLGGAAAWQWQANAYGRQLAEVAGDFQSEREAAAQAVVDWNKVEQAKRQALEERLQANNQIHYRELTDAQQTQARLRDRLATADLRLSVLLANPPAAAGGGGVSAATGAGGVVYAAGRAQLDAAHAQRIVAIVGDGDEGLIALRGCQAYVRSVVR